MISGMRDENEMILVAMDAGTYNVRKATCGSQCITCNGETSGAVLENPFAVGVAGTHQLSFILTWNTGLKFDYSGQSTWTSNHTNLATVANGTTPGKVTGVSPGAVAISAFVTEVPQSTVVCTPQNFAPPQCPLTDLSGNDPGTVTPTISCDTTHLTLGITNFPSTEHGSCTATTNTSGGTFSWTSNKNTIMLSPNGSSATYNSNAASSTQGDTIITVTYTNSSGQSGSANSQPLTIHQPTSRQTNSTTPNDHTQTCTLPCLANPNTGSCSVKSGTSCSYSEPITRRWYSVVDQFGNLFENAQLSGVTITENVIANQGTCGGNNVETGSTGGTPFFDDFGKCDSCCESGGPGCRSTATQTLYANGFAVRNESITVTCSAATLTP